MKAARQAVTVGQQLDMADRVVLAVPLAGGKFRIVEVVKGKDAVGDVIADPVTDLDTAAAADGDPYLLFRDAARSRNGPAWGPFGLNTRIGSDNWLRPLASKATVHGPLGR